MIALLLAAALSVQVADAPCTHEQAMAKGEELSRAIQGRMTRDPGHTRALMDEITAIGRAEQQIASFPDWGHVCATYDAMLQKAR